MYESCGESHNSTHEKGNDSRDVPWHAAFFVSEDEFFEKNQQESLHHGYGPEPTCEEEEEEEEEEEVEDGGSLEANLQHQKKGFCKQMQSPSTSNFQKGPIAEEVATRDQQATISANNSSNHNNLFVKKFSFKDETKILKALLKSHYKQADKEFWKLFGHSLTLSYSVTQRNLYEKVRRLKASYVKRLTTPKSKSNHAMTEEERKLYRLSERIWGKEVEEAKALPKSGDKLVNFVAALKNKVYDVDHFPVAEALNLVPASQRRKLEKKWKDLDTSMIQLFKKRVDIIQKIMGAVVSSSS